jgi:cytochrome c oxidase subunit II
MKPGILAASIASLVLAACGMLRPAYPPMDFSRSPQRGQFSSNGQRIYFTATDQSGRPLSYTGGPGFGGMMMGAYLACADCHGADGRGGVHYIHMQTIDAPPIYYGALVKMLQEESAGTPQPAGYSLEDFRRSVVEGTHPDGDPLDLIMPRWHIGDADLQDLLAFLKTLP